jgi:hypothetical protein
MSTLQELIEQDFGFTAAPGTTKVASEQQPKDDQETTQLMAELGLLDEKTASDNQAKVQENAQPAESNEKVASQTSVDGLFNEMFPEDANLGVQKTAAEAEQEKLAAHQEAVGARAFDHYASRWDARIEKMAADQLTGSATISSSTADVELPSNEDESSAAIDTTPKVDDQVSAKNRKGSEEVGKQEQKTAADLAMKKILLQRALQS